MKELFQSIMINSIIITLSLWAYLLNPNEIVLNIAILVMFLYGMCSVIGVVFAVILGLIFDDLDINQKLKVQSIFNKNSRYAVITKSYMWIMIFVLAATGFIVTACIFATCALIFQAIRISIRDRVVV